MYEYIATINKREVMKRKEKGIKREKSGEEKERKWGGGRGLGE